MLNSPTWISRLSFAGMMPSKKEIETLFQSICRLLLAIVRMRKEEAINIIPAYFGFIKGLLHCFRATAEGIISVPPTEYGQKDSNQQQQQQSSCSYMGFWAPLSADCASSLARIFEQIPQKQTLKSTSLSASTYSESNFKHSDLKFTSIKPFAKHAIYLVAEYVAIQVSDQSIMSGLGNAKEPIVKGIYALLDLCGDHEIDYLLAALGHGSGKGGISGSLGFLSVSTVASLGSSFAVGKDAGRTLFKQLITDYKNKHKYIGK